MSLCTARVLCRSAFRVTLSLLKGGMENDGPSRPSQQRAISHVRHIIGVSPSGKAAGFESAIRWFESSHPRISKRLRRPSFVFESSHPRISKRLRRPSFVFESSHPRISKRLRRPSFVFVLRQAQDDRPQDQDDRPQDQDDRPQAQDDRAQSTDEGLVTGMNANVPKRSR